MILSSDRLKGLNRQKILGINPPVYDFAWFDLWAKPLGLLNLLSFLRENHNEVYLLDCLHEARLKPLSFGRRRVARRREPTPAALARVDRPYYRFGLNEEDILARLKHFPAPDLILVTSIMTYWYPGVREAIALARSAFPKTPVILGGLYASLCPDHAAQGGADFLMTGGPPLRGRRTPLDLYDEPGYGVLATSYGCPRRCHYCASALLEPQFQARPPADITADLERQLAGRDIRDVAFYDDALLWKPETRFLPLCEHIQEQHPELRLHSPNGLSVGEISDSVAAGMYRAGFKTVRLSLEGLDERTRETGPGKTDGREYRKAVARLLKAGFQPQNLDTYLLVGLPGQKIEDLENSIHFVKAAGSRPKLCEFSPIPGTRLFAEAQKRTPEIAGEPLWHNNSVYVPYLSGLLPPEELQRLKALSRENQ